MLEILGALGGGLAVVALLALFIGRFMKVGAGPRVAGPCPQGVEDCDTCRFQAGWRR